jgi:pimeloyl-ACP methyl ester carboxylesterase
MDPEDYDLSQYVVDMTVLISSLGVSEVDWVGTSLGGLIGIVMAGLPNSPIRRLVINDIGPYLPMDAVLRIGRYVRSAPERFPSMEGRRGLFSRNPGAVRSAPRLAMAAPRRAQCGARWQGRVSLALRSPFEPGVQAAVGLHA